MSDISVPPETATRVPVTSSSAMQRLFIGRRGRRLKETLTAYALLFPAFLIIFVFGLFPLAFSAYQSLLTGLNKIVGRYDGLGNYVKAIDNLAYVIGFWSAIVFVYLAVQQIRKLVESSRDEKHRPWIWALPGFFTAAGLLLFTRFFFTFLPEVLQIPDRVPRGTLMTREIFNQLLGEAWALENVQATFRLSMLVLLVAGILIFVVNKYISHSSHNNSYFTTFTQSSFLILLAGAIAWLTYTEIVRVYTEALEDGTELTIWSQVVTISAGFVLLILSYLLWQTAPGQDSMRQTLFRIGAAAALAVGGWFLIGELPLAISSGNKDWWLGLRTTVFFAAGTIPLQFMFALLIANLLFQNIRGKGLYRMIYFLPYISPLVGTAAVFRILFSERANAPINTLWTAIGLEPLRWLNEPTGIFKLMAGGSPDFPSWAAGPSLALVAIIIYNVWTYVGFDIVIFLAGLGSIPGELYEAASIDGAGRWAQFRHVTLPLLSPTIYFLMLLATIGTFKAFNHLYVMRNGAALGTTDTASVVIFEAFKRDTRYGYAASLAMLLLIIITGLTVINNRIARERVFYG
jgi:multiple sugar transport system permease protein